MNNAEHLGISHQEKIKPKNIIKRVGPAVLLAAAAALETGCSSFAYRYATGLAIPDQAPHAVNRCYRTFSREMVRRDGITSWYYVPGTGIETCIESFESSGGVPGPEPYYPYKQEP